VAIKSRSAFLIFDVFNFPYIENEDGRFMPTCIYDCKYFYKNGIWKQYNAAGKLEKTTNWRFGRIVLVNKKH